MLSKTKIIRENGKQASFRFCKKRNPELYIFETRTCACGCTFIFRCSVISKKRYIHGHNRRGKHHKGIKGENHHRYKLGHHVFEERKCACGCNNTFVCAKDSVKKFLWGHNGKGKPSTRKDYHHSEEVRKKIRFANTGKHVGTKNGMFGKPARNRGKHHSEETIKKIKVACAGKRKGDRNSNWLGGISFEPYTVDWTTTLRRSIRERDHYICQLCGRNQEDITFPVHHIDYDKKNCNLDNLITLCRKCNAKVNFNRECWIEYFKQNKTS